MGAMGRCPQTFGHLMARLAAGVHLRYQFCGKWKNNIVAAATRVHFRFGGLQEIQWNRVFSS